MSKKTVKIFNKGDNDLPNYATELSAGFDIRADLSRIYKIEDIVGDSNYFTLEVKDDGKKIITLLPHGRILIPTGLHVAIPEGYELQIRPRSGLALKNGITILNTPGTIDSDYKGEIGLILINTDPLKSFELKSGDRIAQGVLNEFIQCDWIKVSNINNLGESERGEGGFGHSGIK
jgi:dUTP pyrophosphatase